MIHRDRGYDHLFTGFEAVAGIGQKLSYISNEITMGKHSALGKTRGASGILQKGQRTAVHFNILKGCLSALLHRGGKVDWVDDAFINWWAR